MNIEKLKLVGTDIVAIIDAEDFPKLLMFSDCFFLDKSSNLVQVYNRKTEKNFWLHRVIMDVLNNPIVDVDHINHDTLDNRKSNLRVCTHSQNLANQRKRTTPTTSKYKGVYWHKASKKWMARAARIYLGTFDCEVEAAKAYDLKMKEMYGEFHLPNFK